jgi:hypothetical protein
LKESDLKKKKLFLIVDGIGKPQFSLWHDFLFAVLNDEDSIAFCISALSESDKAFIERFAPCKPINSISEMESLYNSQDTIFFTNSAEFITLTSNLPTESTKACFLGGLGSPDYNKQILAWSELNFDFFLSDLLPEELQLFIDSHLIQKAAKNTCFLPPGNTYQVQRQNSTKEQILFLSDSDLNRNSNSLNRIILRVFEDLENARVVKLTNTPKENWLQECKPSLECNVVIVDIESRHLQHYLSELCKYLGIQYHNLNSCNFTSPIRTFLTESSELSDWINNVSPIRVTSLRNTLKYFLDNNGTKRKIKSCSDQKPKFPNPLSFTFIDRTIKEISCKKIGFKLSELDKFYKESYSEIILDRGNHFLNDPFGYILRDQSNGILINAAIEFLSGFAHVESAKQCLIKITECLLRISAKLKHDHGVYHAIYRLLILCPEALICSFQNVYLSAQSEKSYQDFASVVLGVVQNRFIENKVRDLFFKSFQLLNFPPNLSTRNFLACGQLDFFQKALEIGRKDSQKGLVGAAVYQKILQTQNADQDELKTLLRLCEEEISKDLDDVRTHRSLAFLKILLNTDENIAHYLREPTKSHNDFRRFPVSWHEITLFSLSLGREKEAHDLFLSPFDINGGNSAHGRIGALAIAILLNDYDRVNSFASEFPQKLLDDLWMPDSFGYFTAFYHAIIFKFCGIEQGVGKSVLVMNRDRHSHDVRMNKLLEEVSQRNELQKPLKELAKSLFGGMNFLKT